MIKRGKKKKYTSFQLEIRLVPMLCVCVCVLHTH